jgi:hypothetical protein
MPSKDFRILLKQLLKRFGSKEQIEFPYLFQNLLTLHVERIVQCLLKIPCDRFMKQAEAGSAC